jgi:ATP-dependent protease ClpP protease subunit
MNSLLNRFSLAMGILVFLGVSFTVYNSLNLLYKTNKTIAVTKTNNLPILEGNEQKRTNNAVSPFTTPSTDSERKPEGSKKTDQLLLPPSRTLLLQGVVSENALYAAERINELQKESNDPIYLVLIGPGGSVMTGSTLVSAMQASKAPVYTICTTICASMDAVIHQYGKKRFVTGKTILMFHPASASTDGDVDRMYSYSAFTKSYVKTLESDIANRWGVTFDQYKAKTAVELWISAEDAVQSNIADQLVRFTVDSAAIDNPSQLEQLKIRYPFKNNTIPKKQNTSVVPTTSEIKDFDIQWITK